METETPREIESLFVTPFTGKLDAIRCNKTEKKSMNGNDEFSSDIMYSNKSENLDNICLEITFNELFFTKDKKDKIENIIVKSRCPKNDKNKMYLSDFLKDENNNSLKLINAKCECFDIHSNEHLNEYYCVFDRQIICENYKLEHLNHNGENYLISKDKYDSFCLKHILKYTYYCISCNQNLCNKCKQLHNNQCEIKEIKSISQCQIKQLKHKIEIAKNDINNINVFIVKALSLCKMPALIKALNIYKNLNCQIIQYAEYILDITIKKQKSNNLNYQILFNFNNLLERFQSPKYDYLEKKENGEFFKELSIFVKDSNNFILKLKFDENDDNDYVIEYNNIEEKVINDNHNIPNGQIKINDIKTIAQDIYLNEPIGNDYLISKSCHYVNHYKEILKKEKSKKKTKKNGN